MFGFLPFEPCEHDRFSLSTFGCTLRKADLRQIMDHEIMREQFGDSSTALNSQTVHFSRSASRVNKVAFSLSEAVAVPDVGGRIAIRQVRELEA